MLDEIYKLSQHFLDIKNQDYHRYFVNKITLTQRLSVILGQRGVGKTTTIIQYLLRYVKNDRFDPRILYVPADHFLVGNNTLYEIAEEFHNLGGEFIAFDEIHKYPGWSKELKSIYDTFPKLKIIASGSSALEIHKGTHDLTRRAIVYTMYGMSFREYLEMHENISLTDYALEDILKNHARITDEILKTLATNNKKILPYFLSYLQYGYYPYFLEVKDPETYTLLVEQNLHTTIESDLVAIYPSLNGNSVKKIKQLLSFISHAVPFTPNWLKLKTTLEIGDERTLKVYFKYLEDAGLIQTVKTASKKMKQLELPDKVYLNNSNQIFALSYEQHNKGTIRETFFLNILSTQHEVRLPANGDFLVDDTYLFEIGGRKKDRTQLKQAENGYLACDDMESGIGNKIPLWLFGFLY